MTDPLPVVIFAYRRPRQLTRVLQALRPQQIDHLVMYVDGPRTSGGLPDENQRVEACRKLAQGVDWVQTELHIRNTNRGLGGLWDNLVQVFERYPWAIILEEDCLPMPGFYAFMHQALERYRSDEQLFSICGYQPLPVKSFQNNPNAVVFSPRLFGLGWATWGQRFHAVMPDALRYAELFDHLENYPDYAGSDLVLTARKMAAGKDIFNWDIALATACLYQCKLHLLPTRGVVRYIGLGRDGSHSSFSARLTGLIQYNRNVFPEAPENLTWPDQVQLDCDQAAAYRNYVYDAEEIKLRPLMRRIQIQFQRSIWPRQERHFNQDLRLNQASRLKKRALLAYIAHPMAIPPNDRRYLRHINIFHTQQIVRTLNDMGYAVDVISYRDQAFEPACGYDLFIGHGGINFPRLARLLPPVIPKILLTTGCYWKFHNQAESQRFVALEQRRSVKLELDRPVGSQEEIALALADGIIGIGNKHTHQTYPDGLPLYMLDGTTLADIHYDWHPKDYAAGQNHFAFFASGGNVHKGLDLLLEAFTGLEQHLWVAAPLSPEFERVYRHELNELPNIHRIGWTQPRSSAYYHLAHTCNWCILPSCSEGQAQSVIEMMNQGLMPVVSKAAGVDIDGFGFLLEPTSIKNIRQVVSKCAALPQAEVVKRSGQARDQAITRYAPSQFSRNFAGLLSAILQAQKDTSEA